MGLLDASVIPSPDNADFANLLTQQQRTLLQSLREIQTEGEKKLQELEPLSD